MTRGAPVDAWWSGDKYEPYVGRWSRLVAQDFLDWLDVPAGREWLDVGCGTGALAQAILDRASPSSVVGVDPSAGYIDHAVATTSDDRVSFDVADAQALPFDGSSFDAVVSGLMLNFVPDRGRALAEMSRITRRGAVVAAYVWDYPGEMQLMRYLWDTAVQLDPAALPLHEGVRFDFCRPDPLRQLFVDAGLVDVAVRDIVVPTVFRDFDDYWSPFLGGQAPAPSYVLSLADEDREALRNAVCDRLPIGPDGTIALTARAWAVRGRRS